MSPEAEKPQVQVQGTSAAAPKSVARRPAGVPVWRTGKPDAFLAAAVETARTAIEGITAATDIGDHLAAKSEGDRLVTHLFESKLAGYVGWQWYAVLTRNSRSKVVTVSELGLLPSGNSILAPEWVPWAERVRPEDEQPVEEDTPEQDASPAAPAPEESAPEESATEEAPQEDAPEGTAASDAVDSSDAAESVVPGSDAADADFAGADPTGADAGQPLKDDAGTE